MPRRKQNPAIRRKEFIDAASQLFFTKGYESTSIQDILKAVGGESGLSPSVFYYYFSSKDGLFEDIIKEYMSQYTQELIKVLDDTSLNLAAKMKSILVQIQKAIVDFSKIDTYFDRNNIQSERFNQVIDISVRSTIAKPLSRLLEEVEKNNSIPASPLLKEAGPDMLAQIILWSIYPMFHQGKESDGKHHNEKYLNLIPLLFSQLVGIPKEIFCE